MAARTAFFAVIQGDRVYGSPLEFGNGDLIEEYLVEKVERSEHYGDVIKLTPVRGGIEPVILFGWNKYSNGFWAKANGKVFSPSKEICMACKEMYVEIRRNLHDIFTRCML